MKVSEKKKVIRTVERYLSNRYEIIDRDWSCSLGDVFAVGKRPESEEEECSDVLAFIQLRLRDMRDPGFNPDEDVFAVNRKDETALAEMYLSEHLDLPETAITFDVVSAHVYPSGRMFVQLTRNALRHVA